MCISFFFSVLYFLTYTQCCRFDAGFDRLAHYGRAATDERVPQRSAGGRAAGRRRGDAGNARVAIVRYLQAAMSLSEVGERHSVAQQQVQELRGRLRERRAQLSDIDCLFFLSASRYTLLPPPSLFVSLALIVSSFFSCAFILRFFFNTGSRCKAFYLFPCLRKGKFCSSLGTGFCGIVSIAAAGRCCRNVEMKVLRGKIRSAAYTPESRGSTLKYCLRVFK